MDKKRILRNHRIDNSMFIISLIDWGSISGVIILFKNPVDVFLIELLITLVTIIKLNN